MPELVDILDRGYVTGGGCKSELVDDRPYVFFADVLDSQLLMYGEGTYRLAST